MDDWVLRHLELRIKASVTEVLRESDAHLLALVEVRDSDTGEVLHLEVCDPRLEPGEED